MLFLGSIPQKCLAIARGWNLEGAVLRTALTSLTCLTPQSKQAISHSKCATALQSTPAGVEATSQVQCPNTVSAIKIPRASPCTRHTQVRRGTRNPACSCSCNPYEVTRAVPCPFDFLPSVQGERVMSILPANCKCCSYLQVVASHTCNRSVLPCFEAFGLSRGASNVVATHCIR